MKKFSMGVVGFLWLMFVSAAFAADGSSLKGYGGEGSVQSGLGPVSNTPPPPPPAVASSGDVLPFTGLDLGLMVVAALVLVALGLGLRRVSRTRA